MADVISLLKDAPVMNLFVIVGALLVIFAATGRAFTGTKSRKMDTVGRVLLGTCGMAMLGAAMVMFLGLRSASTRAPADLTPSAGAPNPPATRGSAPTRDAAPSQTRVVTSPEIEARWGCEETRTALVSLPVPEGTRFVSAEFEIPEIDKAKSYVRKGPELDAGGRTVSGQIVFQGLDRVFLNCPGGGHARLRLKMTVASP